MSRRQLLADRIVHFFENVANRETKTTVRHFLIEKVPRATVYRVLKRYEERGNSLYKKQKGRPVSPGIEKLKVKVLRLYERDAHLSERAAAAKLGISKTYLHHIKAKLLGIKTFTRKKFPDYQKDQAARAKSACRRIVEKIAPLKSGKTIVLDDECYCAVDPNNILGRKFYNLVPGKPLDPRKKIVPKQKFFKKYLIWQAIDELGQVSKPFISTGTMNAKVYKKECVLKRLVPFIKKRKILFWPDMASCHYTSEVTDCLKSESIQYVEKVRNAPNVPQARPIERFWALCKREYSKRLHPAKNLRSFSQIWSKISSEVAKKHGRAIMANFRKRLWQIGKKGVYGTLDTAN